MDDLHAEFIQEEMPNRVHLSTSCCEINCGGQADIAIIIQHTKPPKINHDLVANMCERPTVVARCPVAAIRPAMVNGKPSLEIDESKCMCCGACYPPCPPMQINDPEHSKLAIWVGGKNSNARRLIFGESDGLPGLIADDYAGHIVLHLSTLAAGNAHDVIVDTLDAALKPVCIIERDDDERMRHERPGSKPMGPAFAVARGTAPDAPVAFREGGLTFQVDLRSGQKTGFYLDQRDNRARVARYCPGATVLNAFSFTGAFAAHGLVD